MIIGLTGGIGSGKTTVANMFAALGIPVYIADIEAKKLMHTSEEIREEITALFGKQAYIESILNRKYIAEIVFSQPEMLQKLNKIVHPRVKNHFINWYQQQKNVPYVIKEAAILFENGSYVDCDKIITITAPKKVRIERLLKRDNATKKDILKRMENQWSDAEKTALSDYVIRNENLEKVKVRVDEIHRELSLFGEKN